MFLSGDIHRAVFAVLRGIAYDIPELTSSPLALVSPGNCNTHPYQTACFDGTNSYVELTIDPTLEPPSLVARLRDEAGAEVESWTILRSPLEAPCRLVDARGSNRATDP